MPFETVNMEEITKARRQAIAESIRTINIDELKTLGDQIFSPDNPWREKCIDFVAENPGATFHYAKTNDDIQIIYCHSKKKGLWFMPGVGMGPMQPKGLETLKQIVEKN